MPEDDQELRVTRIVLFVGFSLLLTTSYLSGQTNIHVPPADPAYRFLEILHAHDLEGLPFETTMPYTRNDFIEATRRAEEAMAGHKQIARQSNLLPAALQFLQNRFGTFPRISGPGQKPKLMAGIFDSVELEYLEYDAPARPASVSSLDAQVQPLTANREGRSYKQGRNLAVETSHWAAFGNLVGFFYQGRLFITDASKSVGTGTDINFETQRFYLQLSKWNLSLLIGKESLRWGPGTRGNLILSGNAEALGSFNTLPLLRLSNRQPIRLPWLLAGMGPMKFEVFVTRLEEDRADFAQPYFIGKRLTFKPGAGFEYGFSHAYILGGKGFPNSISFLDAFSEFFFVRIKQNFIFNIGSGSSQVSENIANHVMGFDFKWTLPALHGLQFYNEFYFDDMTFDLSTTINRNLAYYGGIYLPRLSSNAKLNLRMEFTHTSSIFYRGSSLLVSGFTYNRHILGNELGAFGDELFLEAGYWQSTGSLWHFNLNYQNRGVPANVQFEPSGDERRFIVGARFSKQIGKKAWLSFDLRYQRVQSFAHATGDDRSHVLAGVSLRVNPHFRQATKNF